MALPDALTAPTSDLQVLDEIPEGEAEASQNLRPIASPIPGKLWNPIKEDITNFVRDEIARAKAERSDFERKLARWKLVYDTPLPEGPKTFPFFGASNLTLPVVKEAVNTLTAQLVQATLTARPYWVMKDLASEWEPFVDEIQGFMDIAGDRDLKLDEKAVPWIIEAAKYGTSIIEVGNDVKLRKYFRETSDGTGIYPINRILHDGPTLYNMSLEDFFCRFGDSDIQDSRWCGKRLRMNDRSVLEEKMKGRFFDIEGLVDKDGKNVAQPGQVEDPKEVQEEIEGTEPTQRLEHVIFEIWLSWMMPGDTEMTEIVIYYSEATQKIIGAQFHPYWHGLRPFVKLVYFPVENRFYGQGLCEMLEQIQEAISARFNQRSDNITLASLKIFLKRKGVRGLQPGDPLYSGKIIEVLDIHNDIREMQIGEIYPSTVNEELMLREYGERLSGINEAVLGSASPVTRTTASAQLALLQEQAKRIDLTVRSIRKGINQIGGLTIDLYFQYGLNGKGIAWMGDRGKTVEAIFRLPARVVELGLAIRTSVPTSLQNQQVKRENSLAQFNLLNTMYGQIIPLAAQLAPESLTSVVQAMVKGSRTFLTDVLETFDSSDPEAALAGLTVLERVLPVPEDLGGVEAFARRVESAEVLEKLGGLENLLRQAELAGRRDSGVPEPRGNPPRVPPAAGVAPDIPPDIFFGGIDNSI